MTAAEIMKEGHPLYKVLAKECEKKNIPMSKRQAREFLKKFPCYKREVVAK